MGIRDRIMRSLARGAPDVVDPDAIVELTVVMLFEGPLLLAALERAGIEADGVEVFDYVTASTTRMRILVRAGDAERALQVIQDPWSS